MGGTEQNALQEIDEKCGALRVTSPSAMGSGNSPGGVDTAKKKNQKKEPSSQEEKKAKTMARKVYQTANLDRNANNSIFTSNGSIKLKWSVIWISKYIVPVSVG